MALRCGRVFMISQLVQYDALQSCLPVPVVQFQCSQVVRRLLVDAVIQPVGEQQVRTAPPAEMGFLGGIIIWKIAIGNRDLRSLFLVPKILPFQRVPIILGMTGDADL